MKHLILGASGLLGSYVLRAARATRDTAAGTYHSSVAPGLLPLDLLDPAGVVRLLAAERPDIVYLPAANPNVEWIERNPEAAYAINVAATKRAIDAALEVGAKVLFVSTEYVFDGADGPYDEAAEPHPICVYGAHKLEVERYLLGVSDRGLVTRTTVVYGREAKQKNFMYGVIGRLGRGETMRVPADQIGSPTYAGNAAEVMVALARGGRCGIYNVTGRDVIGRYDFAVRAAQVFGLDARLLEPVPTSSLGQAAARPLRAGMLVGKAERDTGMRLFGIDEGLRAFKADLERSEM